MFQMNQRPLISFTRAREASDLWKDGERRESLSLHHHIGDSIGSGEEAKCFYENLLASVSEGSSREQKACRKRTRREEPVVQPSVTEHGGHRLLKCAQDGNLKALQEVLDKGMSDVNFRDGYYWTALMCAAYAGHIHVVRHLLDRGAAWVGVCEAQGRDALDLAEEAGHKEVVRLLREYGTVLLEETGPRRGTPELKYCAVCKMHYQEDSTEQHERSTVHLFSQQRPSASTHYHIPEHSVGYRLLLKEGWDPETGLGPLGAGRKFPVGTVLKRDQAGLGFRPTEKPKVTHFGANDEEAVAQQPKLRPARMERVATVSRREEKRREEKARAWERDLRTYMNADL
ncbi:G patch domain and ankyrin repeat-containing protein 1 isoform X2 [Rhinatrema bivittatum]|uniref:G patch domain and ankyrin repeat-containing protein 1 isoform X2 n=1 Tax=Rhinatrema bivittatum TaxID=194408 RepID=UPI00112836E3|nr:G patch domain and ankyrin repeat-containing protein 1 isoform X2 [Rhinatrema bivittatum]